MYIRSCLEIISLEDFLNKYGEVVVKYSHTTDYIPECIFIGKLPDGFVESPDEATIALWVQESDALLHRNKASKVKHIHFKMAQMQTLFGEVIQCWWGNNIRRLIP